MTVVEINSGNKKYQDKPDSYPGNIFIRSEHTTAPITLIHLSGMRMLVFY